MKPWAVPLAFVAGWGHIYLRRYVFGTALFVLFAVAANTFLLSFLWIGGDVALRMRTASLWALALVWGLSVAHVVYLALFLGRPAACRRRDTLIEEALSAYLRGHLPEAQRALESALALCPDPHDPDVFFFLGSLAAREGNERRAQKYFRRSERFDEARKWRDAIARQRARLRREKGRPATGVRGAGS